MANTMLNSNPKDNLRNNFLKFMENVKKSGKNPQELFEEVLASGRYSKEQIEKAKQMATQFLPLIKGF